MSERNFAAGMFLADRDTNWPSVFVNRRRECMIIPSVMQGSGHEIAEITVRKATGYGLKGQRSCWS